MVFLHFINIFPQSEKNKPPRKSGQTHHAHLLQEPTCTALVHSVWCLSSQIKPFLIWHEGKDPQGSEEQLQPPPSASSMASPATQTARAGSALLPGATHPHSSSLAASRLTVPHPSLFQLPGPPEQTIHSQCQVSPLLSSVTITFFLFTTLSTKRIQDSQAPLKIHSGPTLKKGKKTPNLRKETH